MCEAADTSFKLELVVDALKESMLISQLESAMQLWAEAIFLSSHTLDKARRLSFDSPILANNVDVNVAQRKVPNNDKPNSVVFAHPVPALAGRALLMAWYDAMRQALETAASGAGEKNARELELRVFKLFAAGLSVPIRLAVNPDEDNSRLLLLRFSEQAFSVAGAFGTDNFWK